MTLMEKKNTIVFGAHIMNINEVTGSNIKIFTLQKLFNSNLEFLKLDLVLLVDSQQLLICVKFDIIHIYEGAGLSIISLQKYLCMIIQQQNNLSSLYLVCGWPIWSR